jgi:CheY-like chemotaxis protein
MKCPKCGVNLEGVSATPARGLPSVRRQDSGDGAGQAADATGAVAIDSILARLDSPDATLPVGFGGITEPRRAVPPFRRGRKRVLIIDADERSLKAARTALEAADVPVLSATSVAVTPKDDDAGGPDLIIVDPLSSGPPQEVIEQIRAKKEWAALPIVFYTRVPVSEAEGAGVEARVLKDSRAPEVLVGRVIDIFRAKSA